MDMLGSLMDIFNEKGKLMYIEKEAIKYIIHIQRKKITYT